MRRIILVSAVVFLALVVACGGGDDDDGSEQPSGGDGASTPAASSGNGGNGGSGGGGGGGGRDGDFCAPDSVDDIFDGLDFATASSANLEEQAGVIREALSRWADRAPGEIRDDVEIVVETVSGLYELLEEYEFNFLALGQAAADDPRFAALDSADFETATANIESYCGFDIDRPSASAPPDSGDNGGGSNGGGTVTLDDALPEGFPAALVPPDSEVDIAGQVGPALTATFRSTATFEEIRDHYEEELGAPTVIDDENLVWSLFRDGEVTAVTVSGTDGAVFIGVSLSGN